MQEKIPTAIGRYRIEKQIGIGAMGVVYLGHDKMIDRKVAIKSIRLDKISSERERKQSIDLFFKEAKTIGSLNHSHITSIYDMGMHEKFPFIVMEFVTGYTIKELIKGNAKTSLDNILKLLAMTARGLHYAHQRGVLHKDIKPANIMVMPNASPKIMDFGIASMKSHEEGESEEEGKPTSILGTPNYMSPEQIRNKVLDRRTDVFSLGVLAYEWISGEKPFHGTNLKEIIRDIIKVEPKPLSSISDIDKELEEIIHTALKKDPGERYKSAEGFSDALEIYQTNLAKKEEASNPNTSGTFSYDQLLLVGQLKKNYVFFSDFTEEELFAIFRLSVREKYNADDTIVEEGTSGAKMYVILTGKVSIVKELNGTKVEVLTLSSGACFGEMAVIDKLPRSASVVATEKTGVLGINEAVLRQTSPDLCLKLYRSLSAMISEKLRQADTRYLDLLSSLENGS